MTRDGYQKITTGENTKKYGFISLLLFQWMDNIFKTGSTGTIEESDFAPLLRENSTASYSKRLQTQWEKERAKSKGNGKRPKLWKSVITMISINEALIMVLPRALYGLWRLPRRNDSLFKFCLLEGKTRYFEDQYLCEGNLPIISVYLMIIIQYDNFAI